MTKDLNALRDELAEEYDWRNNVKSGDSPAFKAGWNALRAELENAAGEFDEVAAEQDAIKVSHMKDLDWKARCINQSRMQFERMSAQLGFLQEKLLASYRYSAIQGHELDEILNIDAERVRKLRVAQIEKLEVELVQTKDNVRKAKEWWDIKDARIKKLEAELAELKMVCRRLSAASSIEVRDKIAIQCAELFRGSILREEQK